MASPRRIGAEDSKTREQLVDAAERLLLREGYAAVTSRRVAAEAGLKPALVHYYFRTMDDLFLAVFRRRAEENLRRLDRVLESPQPLRALWELSIELSGTAFTVEFTAVANHRKAIRAEIAEYAERFRAKQVEALSARLVDVGWDVDDMPPAAFVVLLTSISQVLAMEEGLGVVGGHDETLALVERSLQLLEGAAPQRPPVPRWARELRQPE
jgi:AcrR family transcriptional regulator